MMRSRTVNEIAIAAVGADRVHSNACSQMAEKVMILASSKLNSKAMSREDTVICVII